MATIVKEAVVDSNPAEAWEAVREFDALHDRLAPGFVTGCRMEDENTRVVTFFTGAVARERLIGVDDEARRLAYSVVESPLGMVHNNSAAQVLDGEDGTTRFVWTVDLLPDEAAPAVAQMMEAGLAAIKAKLEQERAAS